MLIDTKERKTGQLSSILEVDYTGFTHSWLRAGRTGNGLPRIRTGSLTLAMAFRLWMMKGGINHGILEIQRRDTNRSFTRHEKEVAGGQRDVLGGDDMLYDSLETGGSFLL